MPLSEAAKALISWDENSRHAPQVAEPEQGGFRAACRCGYEGKLVRSSPSHAYNSTRVHAENENRREAEGGQQIDPQDYTAGGEPPRAARRTATVPPSRPATAPRTASRAGAGTPCGCGCGEPSGGLFRPGHDSKLLSRLLGEIRSGALTLEAAHAQMTQIGTSEVLREKLTKKVNA